MNWNESTRLVSWLALPSWCCAN